MLKLFSLISLLCLIQTAFASSPPYHYEPSEHVFLGDNVQLTFPAEKKDLLLHLQNGLVITYGEALAFGDFYEIPFETISEKNTQADREAQFLKAFHSFANSSVAKNEAEKILTVIHDEQAIVLNRMNRGEKPEEIYTAISSDINRQFNCITGGGCLPKVWWLKPGRFLQLAKKDYDHFGANALIAYETGHKLAIQLALTAGKTKDINQLEIAYAMNAFASHFLSDRFSAGHLRSPRVELAEKIKPNTIGSLLVNFMHNEENKYGLHVNNQWGYHWILYGDRSYFSEKNQVNNAILEKALQTSIDEIYAAFQQIIQPTQSNVYNLIPNPDEIENQSYQDISPLFYWDDTNKKLMRRADLANPFDRHWIANWLGWETFVELSKLNGVPG